jgi:hypothetical protein
MPIYKVEVTETRHVECTYWVDVQIEAGDELEEARRLAKKGVNVHKQEHCYTRPLIVVKEEPKLDDLTPREHLQCQADGLSAGDLDDVVHDILAAKASDINNGGRDEQLAFLLEELGEEEAIQVVNEAKDQSERDRQDLEDEDRQDLDDGP